MSNIHRVTAREFAKFQKVFKEWQLKLGVPEYDVLFRQDGMENIADLSADAMSCTAVVTLCDFIDEENAGKCWLEDAAKHEALHLFLWRLYSMCTARNVSDGEVNRENERVVRILEGLV